MLTILCDLVEAIVAQARNDHPIETCGVIAGSAGSNRPVRLIPMRNIAQSPTFFQFDSRQHLQVWKEMDARDEEPIVLYHSHTQSCAYPSRDDVKYAVEPQAHYVIISTDASHGNEVRSFRIIDGKVTEEAVKTVARYDGQDDK
jgi:proteasome lid subunit RPN8/RPN11